MIWNRLTTDSPHSFSVKTILPLRRYLCELSNVIIYMITTFGSYILIHDHHCSVIITMTSKWAWWRLKSPASRLFAQPFIQARIKGNIKAPRHWPLCGEFTGDRWIPRTGASNAENVSIWWRHHDCNQGLILWSMLQPGILKIGCQ